MIVTDTGIRSWNAVYYSNETLFLDSPSQKTPYLHKRKLRNIHCYSWGVGHTAYVRLYVKKKESSNFSSSIEIPEFCDVSKNCFKRRWSSYYGSKMV